MRAHRASPGAALDFVLLRVAVDAVQLHGGVRDALAISLLKQLAMEISSGTDAPIPALPAGSAISRGRWRDLMGDVRGPRCARSRR